MIRVDLPPRHHLRTVQDRHEVAQQLRRIASAIEANADGSVKNTETLVIFGTTPEGPWGWHTRRTYEEAIEHNRIVSDMIHWARQDAPEGEDRPSVSEVLRERWQRRQHLKLEQEAKAAQHAADHPWQCEWCDRRFRTERGAVQHERGCSRNPAARMYGPAGRYAPILNPAGKIIGFRARQEPSDG